MVPKDIPRPVIYVQIDPELVGPPAPNSVPHSGLEVESWSVSHSLHPHARGESLKAVLLRAQDLRDPQDVEAALRVEGVNEAVLLLHGVDVEPGVT